MRSKDELTRHRDHLAELVEERTSELRMVTDKLPIVISRLDAEQRFIFVNKTAERWFDRRAEQILGETVKIILGDITHERFTSLLDRVLAGQPLTFEEAVTYPDGVTREVDITYVPDVSLDGTVKGVFGMAIDISERKQAAKALAASEIRFRILAETTPTPTVIYRQFDAGFLYANQAAPNGPHAVARGAVRAGVRAIRD